LGPRVVSTKAVNKAGNRRTSLVKLLSELSESNSKLYHISSLSLVYLLEWLFNESEEEESSN
jgi:predicted DNA-binding ribbon-helix-helix protein